MQGRQCHSKQATCNQSDIWKSFSLFSFKTRSIRSQIENRICRTISTLYMHKAESQNDLLYVSQKVATPTIIYHGITYNDIYLIFSPEATYIWSADNAQAFDRGVHDTVLDICIQYFYV